MTPGPVDRRPGPWLQPRSATGLRPVECVVVALAAVAGARVALPVPTPVTVALVAVGAALAVGLTTGASLVRSSLPVASSEWRHRVGHRHVAVALVALATGAVTSGSAERDLSELTPVGSFEVDEEVLLVGDPRPRGRGRTVDVEVSGRRLEASFFGPPAGAVAPSAMGERLHVVGSVRPFDEPWSGHVPRRVVGRLEVEQAWGRRSAAGVLGAANDFRTAMRSGLASLEEDRRAIALGVTIGDDRDLSPAARDDFRAAGLSHLTAVSGQNVAFVIAVTAPLLRRRGRWTRLTVLAGVLVWFGFVTRWEPSVLRSIATAGLVLVVQPDPSPRARAATLGVAAAGLLVADPLLAWSVGFQMSVAATAGIVALAGPLERVLPGPRILRQALAVTLAAQIGVAPVQAFVFGVPSPVAVPANLLAGPAAGALMITAGAGAVAAWLLPEAAALVTVPANLLAAWLLAVADQAAASAGWPWWRASVVVACSLAWWRLRNVRLGPPVSTDTPGPAVGS